MSCVHPCPAQAATGHDHHCAVSCLIAAVCLTVAALSARLTAVVAAAAVSCVAADLTVDVKMND